MRKLLSWTVFTALVSVLASSVSAQTGEDTEELLFAAKLYRVKTESLLDKLRTGENDVSLRVTVMPENLASFETFLKGGNANLLLEAQGEGVLGEQIIIQRIEKQEITLDVDIESGRSGRFVAEPIEGELTWGIDISIKPMRCEPSGDITAEIAGSFSCPKIESAKLLNRKIDLPIFSILKFRTTAEMPGGGALIFGGTNTEDPHQTLLLLIECLKSHSMQGDADDSKEIQNRCITTSFVSLPEKKLAQIVESCPTLPRIQSDVCRKVADSGKTLFLSFAPSAPDTPFVFAVCVQRRYLSDYGEEFAFGKTEWDPIPSTYQEGMVCAVDEDVNAMGIIVPEPSDEEEAGAAAGFSTGGSSEGGEFEIGSEEGEEGGGIVVEEEANEENPTLHAMVGLMKRPIGTKKVANGTKTVLEPQLLVERKDLFINIETLPKYFLMDTGKLWGGESGVFLTMIGGSE